MRPNERLAGGLPNEDAQSFVFDTTSLFERDKFSGFDRTEGGTRANVGLRYTGSFDNGLENPRGVSASPIILQASIPSPSPDLSQATRNAGLEERCL